MSRREQVPAGPLGARKPWEPSRMRLHGAVTVEDVLQALVGRTARIQSSTGTQLEILKSRAVKDAQTGERAGTSPAYGERKMATMGEVGDVWNAMDRAEHAIGAEIGVVRFLTELAAVRCSWVKGCYALSSLHVQAPARGQGELVIGCLRAYHEWALHSQERALAEVWAWSRVVVEGTPCDGGELAQRFRKGECKAWRKTAANLYGDSLLVLSKLVADWNRKCAALFGSRPGFAQ